MSRPRERPVGGRNLNGQILIWFSTLKYWPIFNLISFNLCLFFEYIDRYARMHSQLLFQSSFLSLNLTCLGPETGPRVVDIMRATLTDRWSCSYMWVLRLRCTFWFRFRDLLRTSNWSVSAPSQDPWWLKFKWPDFDIILDSEILANIQYDKF